MSGNIHGVFSVRWCDEVCFVVLEESFNREGVLAMSAAIRQAWQAAGQPARWAHVMDLRRWQGGTPEGFAASHDLLAWNIAHGARAIVRIHALKILARITENQDVFAGIDIPILTTGSCAEAWRWLEAQGIACSHCKSLDTPLPLDPPAPNAA